MTPFKVSCIFWGGGLGSLSIIVSSLKTNLQINLSVSNSLIHSLEISDLNCKHSNLVARETERRLCKRPFIASDLKMTRVSAYGRKRQSGRALRRTHSLKMNYLNTTVKQMIKGWGRDRVFTIL